MLKKIFQFTSILLILVSFIGCKNEIELDSEVGSIQGVVQFENTSNHEGIDVFLESTDGLVATTYYSARGIKSNARIVSSSVKTDIRGAYNFNDVPTGVYTISASSNLSHEKAIVTNVIVQKSAVTELEVIKLKATGNIKGSITIDSAKDNVYGIDILVLGTSYTATTDEDGKYELSDVPVKEGGYSLALRKGDYTYIFKRSVTVTPGESITIDNINIKSSDFNTDSFIWKGFSKEAPKNPKLNWAYFNTTDNCLYIFNGQSWVKENLNGKDGTNGKDGVNGKDGLSIIWKGESETAPKNPELNWAYFNTTDGCSYIWNGSKWDMLAKGNASHVHNFIDWNIISEATEFTEGLRTATCTDCSYEITQIIPKLEIPLVNPEPYGTRVDNLNHIFNNQTLGTTTITMKRSEWNKLCENYRFFYKNENYVHAEKYEYEKDGQTWSIPNVGFRQRGNTSRFCPQGVDNGRLQGQSNADWSEDYYNYAEQPNDDYRQVHFKVDFEEFLEGDEELKMAGCMKGVALKRLDHSWGREIFCYDLFHRYGIWTAPRASHTRLILQFVEDETDNSITTIDYGVYEMFEEVNKQSLKARAEDEGLAYENLWANNKGNLWKCANDLTIERMDETGVENIVINFDEEGNRVDWVWDGYSLDLKTNKDDLASAETELRGFITDLNNLPTDGSEQSIATIKEFYEKWFDMDFFLKTYAISILCGMDDDYWGNANNFYLYFDTGKKGTGKLYFIPFDYDNVLGCSIKEGGFKQNPLEWGRGANRPLMDRMLLVPEYKQKFTELLLEVSAEDSEWTYERAYNQFSYWRSMLEPYANSPDLDWHIGDRYFGDWPWKPSGYSLMNEYNNIFDATRDAIVRNLNGEDVNRSLKISEVECYDGIKIAVNFIPDGAFGRKVYINGKQVDDVSNLPAVVQHQEFFYPCTTNGNSYSIYVEYINDSYATIEKSNTIQIEAKGGLGDLVLINDYIGYTFENNVLTFTSIPQFNPIGSGVVPVPDYYVIELLTTDWDYLSYNMIYISSEDELISLDFTDERPSSGDVTEYVVSPDKREKEIIFKFYPVWGNHNVNNVDNPDYTYGNYRYMIYDNDFSHILKME